MGDRKSVTGTGEVTHVHRYGGVPPCVWGRSGGRATDQDIRHSAERTRQWSTARRRVSMVEDMPATVGKGGRHRGRIPAYGYAIRHLDVTPPG